LIFPCLWSSPFWGTSRRRLLKRQMISAETVKDDRTMTWNTRGAGAQLRRPECRESYPSSRPETIARTGGPHQSGGSNAGCLTGRFLIFFHVARENPERSDGCGIPCAKSQTSPLPRANMWRSLSHTYLHDWWLMSKAALPQLIYCVECHLPVSLEEAQTNVDGKPVHESCYVYRLREAEQRRGDNLR
jgi:hypothetical protein